MTVELFRLRVPVCQSKSILRAMIVERQCNTHVVVVDDGILRLLALWYDETNDAYKRRSLTLDPARLCVAALSAAFCKDKLATVRDLLGGDLG